MRKALALVVAPLLIALFGAIVWPGSRSSRQASAPPGPVEVPPASTGEPWPEDLRERVPLRPGAPLPLVKSSELRKTAVVPRLDAPHDGRNLLWCVTLELAYQRYASHFQGSFRASTSLDPAEHVARVGTIESGILQAIRDEMGRKFPKAKLEEMLPTGDFAPSDVIAFAYLFRSLPFATTFARYDRPFSFAGRDVHAFGVWKDGLAQEAASQVHLLFYEAPERFAIELKTTSVQDRLLLARIPPKATLGETVQGLLDAASKHKPGKMEEGDQVLIPCLNFDARASYRNLEAVFGKPPGAGFYGIQEARQGILFRLDESGATLESWAMLYAVLNGDTPPPPRNFFFNGPFLILLMKAAAATPYFAAWIEDPELLCGR